MPPPLQGLSAFMLFLVMSLNRGRLYLPPFLSWVLDIQNNWWITSPGTMSLHSICVDVSGTLAPSTRSLCAGCSWLVFWSVRIQSALVTSPALLQEIPINRTAICTTPALMTSINHRYMYCSTRTSIILNTWSVIIRCLIIHLQRRDSGYCLDF